MVKMFTSESYKVLIGLWVDKFVKGEWTLWKGETD